MVEQEVEPMEDEAAAPAAPANRMFVAVLSLVGIMIALYTLLYKLGYLGQIACGTGGCERVQLAPEAVQFGVPVPLWGLLGYGAMLIVAVLGLQPAFARARWVSMLLVAGATTALAFSAYLSYLEAYVIGAWCRWCIASAILTVLMFFAVIPEFKRMRSAS